ncbi:MAG: hypothetical protein HQL29_05135 [Candidatus Omnitrophica bacterium]|nr:hypothetical protein [Candidatus Omnitrophota bacterium]
MRKPALNIICKDEEQRAEIQNRLWKLKCRMYEARSSDALLKLLRLSDAMEIKDAE